MKKQSFGTKLKQYRLKRDLTYKQMAHMTGLSIMTICNIEKEAVEPTDRTVYKIRKAFPDLERIPL